jgi:hypothetical protein
MKYLILGAVQCDWKKRLNKSIMDLKIASKKDTLAHAAAKRG